MKTTKKQKWIETESKKAVQIHWDNIDRIKDLEEQISTKLIRIHYFQHSYNKLERQDNYEKYDLGMDLIRDEQKKLAVEIADLQKQIDVNPFEKSVAVMRKNSNEEMLAKKYDKLFPSTPPKKVAQLDNKTD